MNRYVKAYRAKRHPDLVAGNTNSIGKVFNENREALLFSTSKDELCKLVDSLFETNGVKTPKSREISVKLKLMKSHVQAITYVQNIIFAAQNMNTIC